MVTEKRTITVEATYCDFCDKTVRFRYMKCLVCGKDVCDYCNIVAGLHWRSTIITLCPEHSIGLLLSDFIEKLKEKE